MPIERIVLLIDHGDGGTSRVGYQVNAGTDRVRVPLGSGGAADFFRTDEQWNGRAVFARGKAPAEGEPCAKEEEAYGVAVQNCRCAAPPGKAPKRKLEPPPEAPRIGDRVGAFLHVTERTVELVGYGVLEAFEEPGAEAALSVVGPAPRIRLDDGRVVWGGGVCWGTEEGVRALCAGRAVVAADVRKERALRAQRKGSC